MFAAFPATKTRTIAFDRLLCFLLLLTAIMIVAIRTSIAAEIPLWIDETWSAMIATQPNWPSFWREAWLDCNPPLYYLFLAGWIHLADDSNLMLRLPSILFVVAAAAAPLVYRLKGFSRTGVWAWSAFILLWPPGVYVMLDARGYGLILLLATLSCLAVASLLERLTASRAAIWVAIGTLMFLTHYYSATLIAGQGFVLLFRYRARLLRVWPTLSIAIPGFAWFAWHLPRLKDYARADVVWYEATDAVTTLQHLAYVSGAQNIISLGAIVLVVIGAWMHGSRQESQKGSQGDNRNLTLTAAPALIGFVIAILIGLVQPSLTERYLVPLVPPAMLALALVAQRCPRPELAVLALAAAFALPGLDANMTRELARKRAIYGIEQASDFVERHQPDRLLFVWDHPAAKILEPHSLEGVGSYFLKRANVNIPTRAPIVPETADANALIEAAAEGGRPAVIWLYNTARRSAAAAHPPALEEGSAWTCNHQRRATTNAGMLGSIACIKPGDRP